MGKRKDNLAEHPKDHGEIGSKQTNDPVALKNHPRDGPPKENEGNPSKEGSHALPLLVVTRDELHNLRLLKRIEEGETSHKAKDERKASTNHSHSRNAAPRRECFP